MDMERKTASFKLTTLDPEGRTFEGYAAFFNNIDRVDDKIVSGAFRKTLLERGNKIRLLWQHNPAEPIGKPIELREDDNGLFIKAIISDTQRGRDALALLKDGAVDSLSIGYDPIQYDYQKIDIEGGPKTVRILKELRLHEVSIVSFPANEMAQVTAVKEIRNSARTPEYDGTESGDWSAPDMAACISGYYKHVPDAERDEDDEVTEVGQMPSAMRSWIAAKSLLGNAEAETFAELLFFPVVNPSTNSLNYNALRAVISGRGAQADIPDSAKESAQNKARSLIEKEFEEDEEKANMESKPYDIVAQDDEYCVYRVDDNGDPTGDSLGCHPTADEARAQMQAIIANEEESSKATEKTPEEKNEEDPEEVKYGRALSAKTRERLTNCKTQLAEAVTALDELLAETEPEEEDEDEEKGLTREDVVQIVNETLEKKQEAGPAEPPTSRTLEEIKRQLLEIEVLEVKDGLQGVYE